MNELVSIITPSYNTASYIGNTIQSVIDQTYHNWELIIVDDCSSDNTEQVVKSFNDNRIFFIKKNKNSGAADSRNIALKKASGRWIAFLDSDDIWCLDKLEKQINFMDKNNYYFTCTACEVIDEDGNRLDKIMKSPKIVNKLFMYCYCWPHCLTVMYDQNYIGKIQIENLQKNNDYAMWLKVINKSKCYYLDEILASYRKRKGSISNDKIYKLLKSHYDLYRVGEKRSVIFSFSVTIINIIFGMWKKVRYVSVN